MSKRHQASRRRSYGPRRHDAIERLGRGLESFPYRPDPDAFEAAAAADTAGLVAVAGLATRLASLRLDLRD